MSNTGFWQKDQEEVSRISQLRASLQEQIDLWQKLYQGAEDGKTLAEMAVEEDDRDTLREVEQDIGILRFRRQGHAIWMVETAGNSESEVS